MKRKPMMLALALLLVAGTAFAGANQKGQGVPTQGPQNAENCRLLSDEERDKVADAKREFEKIAIPLRADVKVLKIEVDEMVLAGKTAKEISGKLDELNAVQAKLAAARLDHQIAVRKIVGEDKYKQMQMHMKHRVMEGRKDFGQKEERQNA